GDHRAARRRSVSHTHHSLRDRRKPCLPVSWSCQTSVIRVAASHPSPLALVSWRSRDREMTKRLNRRTMLRGLGAAIALPWMESVAGVAGAAGASSKPPVRMCCWYVPNGVHLPTWFPAHDGPLIDLPETLQPLTFARDYLNCFHGLTHNTALTNGDSEGCG